MRPQKPGPPSSQLETLSGLAAPDVRTDDKETYAICRHWTGERNKRDTLQWEWNRLTDVERVEIFLRWEDDFYLVGTGCAGAVEEEIGGLAGLVLHW